jgi:hypothetical protein
MNNIGANSAEGTHCFLSVANSNSFIVLIVASMLTTVKRELLLLFHGNNGYTKAPQFYPAVHCISCHFFFPAYWTLYINCNFIHKKKVKLKLAETPCLSFILQLLSFVSFGKSCYWPSVIMCSWSLFLYYVLIIHSEIRIKVQAVFIATVQYSPRFVFHVIFTC